MIVCIRAGFFARAIKFGGKETQDNVIDLPEDEPKMVAALIRYLYLGVYDGETFDDSHPEHAVSVASQLKIKRSITYSVLLPGSPTQLLSHSKMYSIADKYDVVGLKELASKKFKLAYEVFWNEDVFPIAVDHVFSTTVPEDIGMRDIVIQTISKNMSVTHKAEMKMMVAKYNDLAIGIILSKAG
ncbi:hypothetical protein J4E86_006551 [Alternaria arbusti]|uniref:uncharacterized protein n=1 Tax=Alternaria arbusti TaxID=232088 RepID=UPI002220D77F|nr:uncharacterized protein J4E86_006551 [Alternaria arbusti]KAI4953013.1 hypothetical protein J4E86_006551 [Alternaria arbusti]